MDFWDQVTALYDSANQEIAALRVNPPVAGTTERARFALSDSNIRRLQTHLSELGPHIQLRELPGFPAVTAVIVAVERDAKAVHVASSSSIPPIDRILGLVAQLLKLFGRDELSDELQITQEVIAPSPTEAAPTTSDWLIPDENQRATAVAELLSIVDLIQASFDRGEIVGPTSDILTKIAIPSLRRVAILIGGEYSVEADKSAAIQEVQDHVSVLDRLRNVKIPLPAVGVAAIVQQILNNSEESWAVVLDILRSAGLV